MNFGVPEVTTGVSCRHLYESMDGLRVEKNAAVFCAVLTEPSPFFTTDAAMRKVATVLVREGTKLAAIMVR